MWVSGSLRFCTPSEFRSGLVEDSPFLLQISKENIQDSATASSPLLWTERHFCPKFEPRFGGWDYQFQSNYGVLLFYCHSSKNFRWFRGLVSLWLFILFVNIFSLKSGQPVLLKILNVRSHPHYTSVSKRQQVTDFSSFNTARLSGRSNQYPGFVV